MVPFFFLTQPIGGSGKSKKTKKKKDKTKQILNVEVNFSDRKEERLLNEHSVLSDEDEAKEYVDF